MGELARLFPTEIAYDPEWPCTAGQEGSGGTAKLLKYAVVKVPRSVYAAIPGRNKFRPSQRTPIPNLTMAGDWTSQKYLGSMEGAVFGGKLAAEVLSKKAKGMDLPAEKEIQSNIIESANNFDAKDPIGVIGEGAIAFGGGATLTQKSEDLLREVD